MTDLTFPADLSIGPYDYTVTIGKEHLSPGHIGECDFRKLDIRLDPEMPAMRLADTYIHEILHAIWDVAGLQDGVDEESAVSALSTGLLVFMRDNPHGFDPVWEALGRLRRSDLADKLKSRGTFG